MKSREKRREERKERKEDGAEHRLPGKGGIRCAAFPDSALRPFFSGGAAPALASVGRQGLDVVRERLDLFFLQRFPEARHRRPASGDLLDELIA